MATKETWYITACVDVVLTAYLVAICVRGTAALGSGEVFSQVHLFFYNVFLSESYIVIKRKLFKIKQK